MKYLIFDASGISKPKSWKAPFSDTFSWPRLLHVSWIILDENFKPVKDYDCIITPEGFSITPDIEKFCHLTEEEIKEKGTPLEDVLKEFDKSVQSVEFVFAHNLGFNQNIMAAEYVRMNMRQKIFYTESFCLMQESTYFCKLPSKKGGYKWPSLSELHTILFKQKYTPSNNARADVIAATRCFIMLMKVGALEDLFDED